MSFDNQAEYYVDPIPSFRFLQHKYNFVQNPNRRIVWRQYSGHSFYCSCDSAVAIFGTQELQANMDYCYVRRRAECTSLGPGLNHLQAYAQTLVWLRRDVPRRFTWLFFSTHSIRAQHVSCCSVCTLAWDVATKDARWVRCSPCSLGPSPRQPTASCNVVCGCGEARRLRSRIMVVFVVQRIDRCPYVWVYLVLLLYQAG